MNEPEEGPRRSKLTASARRLGGVSLAEILSRAIGFIAFPFITRALGPTEFGSLSYVVAVTSWVGVISAPGLYAYGLREVAQKPDQARHITGELMTLSLSVTSIAYVGILAYAFLGHLSSTERTLFILVGATLPLSSIDLSWAFIGVSRAGAVSALTAATNLLYMCLVILWVHDPSDVTLVPGLQLLQSALIAAGLLVLAMRLWGRLELGVSRSRAAVIIRGAIPLGLGTVMTMIYNRVDVIMVAAMRGRTEAGLYAGAYRIMEVAVLLPLTLMNLAIMPSITGAFGRDIDEASAKVEVYFRHFLLLAIPVGVGGILLRGGIVRVVLGPAYERSADVFGALSLNLLVGGMAALFAGCVLVGLRRNGIYLAAVATGAVVNVVLNLLFIPRFGMMAAAVATLIAQAAVATFAFTRVRRLIKVDRTWLRYFPKPIVASALMAIPVLLLRDVAGGVWLAGSVGALTYGVAIIVLRAADLRLVMSRDEA
jgi:O-antigen/teichoic acid export membrane protein